MSKARKESILKSRAQQSHEFGQKVIDWMHTPQSDDCVGGTDYARQQLALDGIIVRSDSTFSDFYSWWFLQETFRQADNLARDFEEMASKKFPEVDPKKIQDAGQSIFTLRAMNSGNAEEFREMEKLRLAKQTAETKARQEEKKLQLAERRVVLLEEKIDKAKKTLTDPSLNAEQREQRMKQMFGLS